MNPYVIPMPDPNLDLKEENQQESKECKCKTWIKEVCKTIGEFPLITKIVVVFMISSYILSLFIWRFGFSLVSFPYGTIMQRQFYRLFTAPFVMTRVFNLLLALIIWVPKVTKYEKSIGTIRYGFLFFINTFAIQLIDLAFFLIQFYFNIGSRQGFYSMSLYYWYCVGILPYAFMEITMDYLANIKNTNRILCLPSKVHLFVYIGLFGLCIIVNLRNAMQLIVGVVYGVIYFYCLRDKLYLSEIRIAKWEQWLSRCLSRNIGFISLKDAQEYNQAEMNLDTSEIVVDNQS